jgi:hypothetical protein
MLMRPPPSERIASERRQARRSKSEVAHLDELLDEALCETFPASDPIAITIDKPPRSIAFQGAVSHENLEMPPQAKMGETIVATVFDPWGINQIFHWWSLLLGGRSGK